MRVALWAFRKAMANHLRFEVRRAGDPARRRPSWEVEHPNWMCSPLWFAKRGWLSCDCRARHHGRPKEGHGICKVTGRKYRAAVEDRIRWRRAVGNLAQWMRAGLDPLDFEG